ncbi:MAG: TetR/AcrR family transcriptional regulator [Vicinamibacterales bacterium]
MSVEETRPHGRPGRRPGYTARRTVRRRKTVEGDIRVAILKSAAAEFRRRGYHGATVEHIAAKLRMKKGNLYYYFRNKEEILFACHQFSLDQLLALLEDVESSGLPAEARLRKLIVAFVHTILDELQGTALFLDLEALSPAHRRAVVARRDLFDRAMRQVLAEGVGSGTFGKADPKLLSFAILGAVNWIPRWYSPDGPATSQTIADTFADFLIAGLREGRPI